MAVVFDTKAPKQAANLSINSDLLSKARQSGVSLSATLEEALAEKVTAIKREEWLRENAQAIERYNDLVATHGVFSDATRSF